MADPNPELAALLHAAGQPDQTWWAEANTAFELLEKIIGGRFPDDETDFPESSTLRPGSKPWVFKSALFERELSWRDESLSCHSAGIIRPHLHLDVVWETITAWKAQGLSIMPIRMEPGRIEIFVSGYTFDVSYWQIGQSLSRMLMNNEDLSSPDTSQLSISDISFLAEHLLSIEACQTSNIETSDYRQAFHFIKAWAITRGLLGPPSLGLAESRDVVYMLSKVEQGKQVDAQKNFGAGNLLWGFFEAHLTCEASPGSCPGIQRVRNAKLIDNSDQDYFKIFHRQIKHTYQEVVTVIGDVRYSDFRDLDWASVLKNSQNDSLDTKLTTPWYILINAQVNSNSQIQTGELLDLIQTEVFEFKQTHKPWTLPKSHLRIWPNRLVPRGEIPGLDSYCETSWVIGVELDRQEVGLSILQSATEVWLRSFNKDPFVSKVSVQAEIVDDTELRERGDLVSDSREWPKARAMKKNEENPVVEYPEAQEAQKASKEDDSPPSPHSEDATALKAKFRPALDVLHRLRHDPSFNLDNYVIGYRDRFAGNSEAAARNWITETSSEDFIPQSRINYFRRITDGVVVWDRKARKDSVFR